MPHPECSHRRFTIPHSATPSDERPLYAKALKRLFETHRSPSGGEYSLGEVSRATGISVSYLSLALRGGIERPSAEKVQVLASFFGVDTAEVTGAPPQTHSASGSPLEQALDQPLVAEIALRAGLLGKGERAFILALIDDARRRMLGLADSDEESGSSGSRGEPERGHDDGDDQAEGSRGDT